VVAPVQEDVRRSRLTTGCYERVFWPDASKQ